MVGPWGARYVAQSAAAWPPAAPGAHADVVVDVVHAASMLGLAALDPRTAGRRW